MDVDKLVQKYGPGQPAACGLNFDFSSLYQTGIPQLWQISTLADIKLQNEIISELKDTADVTHDKYLDAMIKILPTHKPRFESCEALLARA